MQNRDKRGDRNTDKAHSEDQENASLLKRKDRKERVDTDRTAEDVQEKIEKEQRDKAGNDLDDIEKIIANDSGFCANFMLLVIYVILIIQIFLEYRIPEVHGSISSINKYVSLRISTDLSQIQTPKIIYDEFLYKLIESIHDHSDQRNMFTLMHNPLIDASPEYNVTKFIFLENYNYYLGSVVKLSLKHVDKDPDADLLIRKIIKIQNTDVFETAQLALKGEPMKFVNSLSQNASKEQKEFITVLQQDSNFDVSIRFDNQMEKETALELLQLIEEQFRLSSLFKVEHNIYTLNPITEILLKTSYVFDTNVYGKIKFQKQTLYANYLYQASKVQKNVDFAIAIKSIFAFVVFVQIIYTIGKRVFFMIIKFLSTRIFEFEFDLLIITAQRTLNLIYVVVWFIGYSEFQNLSIGAEITQAQLDSIDGYLNNFSLYQLFAIVTFIISIYDLIKIMTSFFPTFGVLLYTFEVAGKDILIFVSYTSMMLISFIIIGNIIFGPKHLELSSFINAAFFCFEFLSGQLQFTKLASFESTIGYGFGVVFFICFVLILLPYLFGIIIYTYGILREKMQMPTQALAEIAADKSTAATMKWINLIFFLPPKTEEQLAKEQQEKEERKKKKLEKQEEERKNARKKKKKQPIIEHVDETLGEHTLTNPTKKARTPNKTKDGITPSALRPGSLKPGGLQTIQEKQDENDEKQEEEKELSMEEIFMYNLQQLDIKNVILSFIGLGQEDLLTKQQRVEEIQKKTKEIQERMADQKKVLKKMKEDNLFTNLKDGFLHIIFLIFVILGFQSQTIKSLTFDQESYINSYFSNIMVKSVQQTTPKNISIQDIETTYQFNQFLTEVIFQTAATQFQNDYDQELVTDFNLIVGNMPIRITFRLYEHIPLNFFSTNSELIFRGRSSSDMSPTSGGQSEERQINLYVHGNEYRYIIKGTTETAFTAGGFKFAFDREISEAVSEYEQVMKDYFLTVSTGLINVEFVLYNPSYDLYSFVTISFIIKGNGRVDNQITINTFPITLYSGDRLTRLVFELIVLYFHYKFWRMFFNQWEAVWNDESSAEFTPFDLPEDKKVSKIEYYMNIDLSDKKNASLAKLSFAIAKRLYGFAMRLLASLRLMVLQTFFNILLITGIIMMFVQIIYWLQITFNEFRMTFDFFESFWFANKEPENTFENMQYLSSLFKQYNTMTSFILFNEMVRIMFYFSFSAKLSLVLDIIASASLDIIFFMIMFCLIVFAFACIGVLSFGHENPEFQNLLRSVIKSIELFEGQSSMERNDGENYSLANILFYFLLVIILFLVFIRMLIAILDGHFLEIMKDDSAGRLGLVDTIMSILKNEYEKVQKEQEEQDGEDEDQEEVQVTNKSKWAIIAYFQEKTVQLTNYSIKIYKLGLKKFEEYRNMLFGMLFQKPQDAEEREVKKPGQEGGDNGLQLNLQFEDTGVNQGRLVEIEEIQVYNHALEAAKLMEELSGTKLKNQQFKTTQVNTWIEALLRGIKDVASNSLNFDSYYTPISEPEKSWIRKFQFDKFDQLYNDLKVEIMGGGFEDGTLKPELVQHYGRILCNNVTKAIQAFPQTSKEASSKEASSKEASEKKKEIYEDFLRILDQYFFFYLNVVLIEKPEQYLTKKPLDSHAQRRKKPEENIFEIDISLLDISTELQYFQSEEGEIPQNISLIQRSRTQRSGGHHKSYVNKAQTMKNNFAKFKPNNLKTMNSQQMIYALSRISDLCSIWAYLKFNDKISLWFGYDFYNKQFNFKNKFQIYQKVAFWNQTGWDKKTFTKIGFLRDFLDKFNDEDYKAAKEDNSQEYYLEYIFQTIWKGLHRSSASMNPRKQNMAQQEDQEVLSTNHSLPVSQAQIDFVKYLLRGSDNLISKLSQLNTFEKKIALLRNSHIANEHKIVIWLLESPFEKIKLIMEQEQKQQQQFMILLLLEELYENFIMLNKIEKDLSEKLNSKINSFYQNFAEFNALATAVTIREKYTSQSVNDKSDYANYITFLQKQLKTSNESLGKYSNFLIHKLSTQKTKALFKDIAQKSKDQSQKEPGEQKSNLAAILKQKAQQQQSQEPRQLKPKLPPNQ